MPCPRFAISTWYLQTQLSYDTHGATRTILVGRVNNKTPLLTRFSVRSDLYAPCLGNSRFFALDSRGRDGAVYIFEPQQTRRDNGMHTNDEILQTLTVNFILRDGSDAAARL